MINFKIHLSGVKIIDINSDGQWDAQDDSNLPSTH